MAFISYKASAPGSLMLLGEHAVLQGKHAIVCALDKRMTVTLSPHANPKINIVSALGELITSVKTLAIVSPFQFILAVLVHFKTSLPSGFLLNITSDFSHKIGFGSSAAVTVATISVINSWLTLNLTSIDMILLARQIIQQVQGTGSGADAAASVLGGMVAYQMQPLKVEKLPFKPNLSVIYSGYKTATQDVIRHVENRFSQTPQMFVELCQAINECVVQAIGFAHIHDVAQFGKMMNRQQILMAKLGVSTELLDDLVEQLRSEPSIAGAKISGSGLGDCIVGIGSTNRDFQIPGGIVIPVVISNKGVDCEKI